MLSVDAREAPGPNDPAIWPDPHHPLWVIRQRPVARADDRDDERVVVHDRYHRTHDAAPSRAEQRARARLVRARQLALVRERARQLTRNSGTP